jgi:PBSX family phage terminase large subunit
MWGMLCKEAEDLIIDKNESRLELTIRNKFGGKSLLALYGWEAVRERKKGVGVKNNFIVLDEVSKYKNFQEGWQEALRPTLTDLKGHALFISTPNGFNHFYDLSNMEATDPDYKSFHFTSYDNPFLPVEEIEKTKQELTEDRFAQEYMADFRRTEGLVYKEFNRGLHLYDKLGEAHITERLLGVDFGYTNPTAMILVLKDGHGNYYIESEWYKTQQTNDLIAEVALSFKPNRVYPDPEAPEKITELRRGGLNCMEVKKGKDSITNGIQKVRELFKQGKLKINRACVNTIWELETYSYPEKRPDQPNPELPIKENDHLLDALRYVLNTNKTPVHYKPDYFNQTMRKNPAR